MHMRLGGSSHATLTIHSIEDTGSTNDMDQNYGSFLIYHHSYSDDYVTLGNRSKYPISGYVTTLVRLGGKVNKKWNVYFHVTGLRAPLYSLHRHRKLTQCGYIGNNKTKTTWPAYFPLTIENKVENLVH